MMSPTVWKIYLKHPYNLEVCTVSRQDAQLSFCSANAAAVNIYYNQPKLLA